MMYCPTCGSGNVKPQKAGWLYAEVCQDCGTVFKIFNTAREQGQGW